MHWLLGARIDRARELLEASDRPWRWWARLSGLGTAANLRALFKRHTGVSPSTYRSTFHRPAHAGGAEDPAAP
jgi:transcriptional regulator GlxA family with amidase domain